MRKFSSILFFIFINLLGALIPIVFFPAFIFRSSTIADKGAKVWSRSAIFILKLLCGLDYKVVGLDKLPKEACIIACKHQSMWETIIMHLILDRPVYAYKKELEKIPFYGWFVAVMSGISIDRKGGAKALKNLVKQAKKYLKNGQKIVIFPQGTRVPLGESSKKYPYQAGIAALYSSCGVKIVPVALNSGAFWPKHQLEKKSGIITIEFLDPIEPGLQKKEFIKKLEDEIENKSIELSKSS